MLQKAYLYMLEEYYENQDFSSQGGRR